MKNKQNGFGIVGALGLIVVIIAVVSAGLLVWHRQSNSKDQPVANDNAPSRASESGTSASNIYKIDEMRLELQLNEQTKDIVAKVDGSRVWFTLRGFLDRANAAGYSRIINGKNNCEQLAGVVIFKDATEVRANGTEVTGDLIDANGDPIQDRIIKLNDNRYALPIRAQAPCNRDASFDSNPLSGENKDAINAIQAVISSGLRSY